MTPNSPSDDAALCRRYLLGQLSEAEREAVADRLFQDDQFAEHLEAEERELLDAYRAASLSSADASAVEERLLASPAQRAKLAFAATWDSRPQLIAPAGRRRSVRRQWTWLGLAAAILLATVLLRRPAAVQPQPETKTPVSSSSTTGPVVTALLTPGLLRDSADRQTVSLPDGTGTLRLNLIVEATPAAPRYRVVLLTGDQPAVWQASGQAPHQESDTTVVTVDVPVTPLARRRDYRIELYRGEQNTPEALADVYSLRLK